MSEIRIAIVQSKDGYYTVCGPNDFKESGHSDAMDAAMCWHLEAGHIPVQMSWATVEVPAVPEPAELRAMAERGEFPKSIIAEWDASQ